MVYAWERWKIVGSPHLALGLNDHILNILFILLKYEKQFTLALIHISRANFDAILLRTSPKARSNKQAELMRF